MKKYLKLATVILTSSMLFSGVTSAIMLANRNTTLTNNQALLNDFSESQQSDDVQIVNSVNDIEFVSNNNSSALFAIVRDAANGDRLYAWGRNYFGELGLPKSTSMYNYPTIVKNFWGAKRITNILKGSNFSLIVLDNNEIYATGSNEKGQFGDNGIVASSDEFIKVMSYENAITSISVGGSYAAAIINNELYTWGDNSKGQLGLGADMSGPMKAPVKVETSMPGTLKKVRCGPDFTVVLVEYNGSDNFYICGDSRADNYLGVGAGLILSPTLLPFNFVNRIVDFYLTNSGAGYPRVYFTTERSELYAMGSNYSDSLGLGVDTSAPIIITQINEQIEQLHCMSNATIVLTTSGDVYSTGNDTYSGQVGATVFKKNDSLANIERIFGCDQVCFASSNEKFLVWGENYSGAFGDYEVNNSKTPIQANPFSTPSSLVQIEQDNANKYADIVAKEIYSDTSGFAEDVFDLYVKKEGFFDDTKYTMTSAPTANVPKGEIKCTVQASKSYTQPDGAKSVTAAPFDITLTGFQTQKDSALVKKSGKPWATEIKYENIMTKLGENDTTNLDNLKKIYDLDTFPTTSTFKISNPNLSFDSDTRMGAYTADLIASEYYLGGNLLNNGTFKIVVDEFPVNQDSTITERTNIDANIYNLTNVDKKLRPGNVLQPTVLTDLFTTTVFADGNNFTSVSGGVVGKEYHVTIKADKAYVDGLIVSKDFELKIKGLTERPNSNPVTKAERPWLKYQYNTIQTELGEGATTDQAKLIELYDFNSFPTGTTYAISNAGVTFDRATRMGTYKADVTADKHYLDGNIDTNKKTYPITMDGFSVQVDSDITQKPDLDTKKYNLTNINNKLCPNGALDKGIFKEIFITPNLPTDATLTSTGGTVNGGIFNITITSDKAWFDGFVIGKPFTLAVIGLQLRPDSSVIEKTPSLDELDDLISKLKDGEVIDTNTLGKLIDLSEFPDGTNFTINTVTPDKENSTIKFVFTPDKAYKNGNVEANTGTFDAEVKFVSSVVSAVDNAWLLIGLGIGAILLMLIIIGLLIWYLRRKNKDSSSDIQSILY